MSETRTDTINNASGDNDSGIDLSTNDQVDIKTADTTALTVDASQNVGIGTSSPSSLLDVQGNLRATHSSGDRISLNHDGTNGSITNVGGDFLLYASSSQAMIMHTNGSQRMRIRSNGAIDFNTTSNIGTTGDGTLNILVSGGDAINLEHTVNGNHVVNIKQSGTTTANYFYFVKNGSGVGSISCSTTATSYNTSSDHRLKENVEDMTGAIARVKQLLPKRFNFIADDTNTLVDGFLAHEAQSVVAEAVTGTHNEVDDDGNAVMQGIDQSKLVPLLTGALKEAIAKIEALETRIEALENA